MSLFDWISGWLGHLSADIGIDLGTANTLVYVKGRGIVLREPSVVAIDLSTDEVLAVGEEAKNMIGKTPSRVVAMRPLKDGVIADWEKTEAMLSAFIRKAKQDRGWFQLPHRVVIGIPSGITAVERKAVRDAAIRTGARWEGLIDEPMAAAIGCNMPIEEAGGNMIVDIGGGTTEVAVISLGGVVVSNSIRTAGDELDRSIIDYARRRFNLQIGERTAERIKINIGAAHAQSENLSAEMRGMDQVTGLPKVVEITTEDIREAMSDKIDEILRCVRYTLEECPPELAADIIEQGIVLAGGGALVRDLDILISRDTGIVTRIADDPLSAVVLGTMKVLEDLDRYKYMLN
ncbi:MAG TPA: rod shape-determining protein [Firmicutes bacterium]|nr:rod shape-determining protein [Bacillota bacterium]